MSISNDISSTNAGTSGTSGGDTGGGMKETVKHLGAVAADKATQLKDSAQEYLHAGKEKAAEYLGAGREKASEYLEAGREKASEYYEISKAKAQEWEHTVEEYIREKPLQSVLIAAGVGAVLGFLLRR